MVAEPIDYNCSDDCTDLDFRTYHYLGSGMDRFGPGDEPIRALGMKFHVKFLGRMWLE